MIYDVIRNTPHRNRVRNHSSPSQELLCGLRLREDCKNIICRKKTCSEIYFQLNALAILKKDCLSSEECNIKDGKQKRKLETNHYRIKDPSKKYNDEHYHCISINRFPDQVATSEENKTSFTEESYLTWSEWKVKYKKTYKNQDEEEMRKKIWEESLKEIKEHNAKYYKGEFTFRVNLTDLCDQKTEELWWMDGVADSSDESWDEEGDTDDEEDDTDDEEDDDGNGEDVLWDEDAGGGGNEDELVSVEQNKPSHSSTPDNEMVFDTNAQKDWRVGNHVTPVKSQRRLPACWIFAAVAAVESHLSITTGQLFELSIQQVVDCCEGGDKKGSLRKAFKYILKNGLMCDKLYPYEERKRTCRVNKEQCHAKISKWKEISGDEKELENVVQRLGPVAVTLKIFYGKSFDRLEEEDIFRDDRWKEVSSKNPSNERMRHCVLVVGFGTDPKGNNYWIIKDSLRCNPGFKKLAKDADNMCDVAGAAVYPVKAAKPLRKRRK